MLRLMEQFGNEQKVAFAYMERLHSLASPTSFRDDPLFGNLQDAPSLTTKRCKQTQSTPCSGIKGTSFASTVAPVENKTHGINMFKQLGRHVFAVEERRTRVGFVSPVGEKSSQRE